MKRHNYLWSAGRSTFSPWRTLATSRRRVICAAALAAAIPVALAGSTAYATDYSWSTATSGNWTTSALWTPSGYPNAIADTATIGVTGAAYTVTLSSNITVASLTLSSSTATLLNNANTFTFTNAFLDAGTYTLNGGTMSGGTSGALITLAGGTLNVQNGALSNISVTGGDLRVNNSVHILGSLSIANTKLDLAASSTVYFQGQSVDNLTITPASTAVIYAESGGSVATLTLGSNVLVHGGMAFNDDVPGDGLVNNGVINGDNSTYSSAINLSKLTNNGTLEASNGGTLNVGSSATTWTNAGTILAAAGSHVNLGGTITLASAGTFNGTAGTISISGGTLNNAGSTVTLNANTGNLFVANSGTINGGTINESGGATLNVQSGSLVNVAITGGDLNVTSSAHVLGTLSVANHNLDLASAATLYFQGQTVDNLNITSPTYASIEAEIGVTSTLTLGPGVTVQGGVKINNDFSDTLINNGVINADNPSYGGGVYTSYFTNNGTVEATNGASITIGSLTALTNTGRLYVNNGTLTSSNTINVGSGSLGGTGTISAAVSLGNTSSLVFNLGGTTKGSGYDSLTFQGNLSLGGDLKLFLINGFLPTASQSFTIVTTANNGTISNAFMNVANGGQLETAAGNGAFTVTYNANQIVLSNFQTVPEPTGIAILGISATGILRRRGKKRLMSEK